MAIVLSRTSSVPALVSVDPTAPARAQSAPEGLIDRLAGAASSDVSAARPTPRAPGVEPSTSASRAPAGSGATVVVRLFDEPVVAPNGVTFEKRELLDRQDAEGMVDLSGVSGRVAVESLKPHFLLAQLSQALRQQSRDQDLIERLTCCPLTLDTFEDPVIVPSTGHTVERAFLKKWLADGNTDCPLTRKKIAESGKAVALHPDIATRNLLAQLAGAVVAPSPTAPDEVMVPTKAPSQQTMNASPFPPSLSNQANLTARHMLRAGGTVGTCGIAGGLVLGGLQHMTVAVCMGVAAAFGIGGCVAGAAIGFGVAAGTHAVVERMDRLSAWAGDIEPVAQDLHPEGQPRPNA